MKLVINTQFMENYGAHDWDGVGSCPQYWKAKGGDTYVVEGFSWGEYETVKEVILPSIRSLIENRDDYSEEYIIGWSLEEDDADVCEEWETPIVLTEVDGTWVASKYTETSSGSRSGLTAKQESWTLAMGGLRMEGSYKCEYLHETEGWVSYDRMVEIWREYEARVEAEFEAA